MELLSCMSYISRVWQSPVTSSYHTGQHTCETAPHCGQFYGTSLSWTVFLIIVAPTVFIVGTVQKEASYFRYMPLWRVTWRNGCFPSCTPTPHPGPACHTNPGICSHLNGCESCLLESLRAGPAPRGNLDYSKFMIPTLQEFHVMPSIFRKDKDPETAKLKRNLEKRTQQQYQKLCVKYLPESRYSLVKHSLLLHCHVSPSKSHSKHFSNTHCLLNSRNQLLLRKQWGRAPGKLINIRCRYFRRTFSKCKLQVSVSDFLL